MPTFTGALGGGLGVPGGIQPGFIPGNLGQISYDQWGQVQFPTTSGTVFTPVRTDLWVSPASVPAEDPALAVILDFLATWLTTDGIITAAYSAHFGTTGSNSSAIARIFPHNPADVVFSAAYAPALFLWRDSAKHEYAADDWLRDTSVVKGLWVFPPTGQDNQRIRAPFVNALVKSLSVGIERGRTPSWLQTGDVDPSAKQYGSLFYTYANFESFMLESWRAGRLEVPGQQRIDAFPAVELTFRMEEKLDLGLGKYPILESGYLTEYNPSTGATIVSGPLPGTSPGQSTLPPYGYADD